MADSRTHARTGTGEMVRLQFGPPTEDLAAFVDGFVATKNAWEFAVRVARLDSFISPAPRVIIVDLPTETLVDAWRYRLAPDEWPTVVAARKNSPAWLDLARDVGLASGSALGAWRVFKWVCQHPADVGGAIPTVLTTWKVRWAEYREVAAEMDRAALDSHDDFRSTYDKLEKSAMNDFYPSVQVLRQQKVSIDGLDDLNEADE